MIAIGIIILTASAGCIVLGILQLLQKGPLINNAWLYADEEKRRTMNKAPYYRQSGIVFLMIGIQFCMLGLHCLTMSNLFLYAEFAVIGLVLVYAVVSTKKKKKR